MAKYILNNKEVTEEEFNKQVFKAVEESPFFLDEIVSVSFTPKSDAKTEQILNEIRKIAGKKNKTEETLEDILKRNMSIGAPDYGIVADNAYDCKLPFTGTISHTGGTVFEKVQDSTIDPSTNEGQIKLIVNLSEKIKKEQNKTDAHSIPFFPKRGKIITYSRPKGITQKDVDEWGNYIKGEHEKIGKKETVNKTDYSEIDWQFITQLAERMNKNKDKYEPGNWKKLIDVELLKQSLLRHVIAVLNSDYEDDERPQGHLEAIALNAQMINYQLKNK